MPSNSNCVAAGQSKAGGPGRPREPHLWSPSQRGDSIRQKQPRIMCKQRGMAGFQQTLSTPDENFTSAHRGGRHGPASTGAGHDNELELSRTLRGPSNGGNSGSQGARGDVRPVSQGSAGVAVEITNEGSTSSFASFRGGRHCYSTNARQTSFLRLYVQIFICPVRLKKKQRRRNSVTVTTCESWLEWNPGCSTKKK